MGLIAHRTMNEYWDPLMVWGAMKLEFYDFWSFWVSSIFSSFISLNFFNKLAFCASIFSLPAVSKTNPVPRRSFCWKWVIFFTSFGANINPERSTFSSKCSIQGSVKFTDWTHVKWHGSWVWKVLTFNLSYDMIHTVWHFQKFRRNSGRHQVSTWFEPLLALTWPSEKCFKTTL